MNATYIAIATHDYPAK